MSDFLNNLARRSLGSAEILRPRLPSLFEPGFAAAGALSAPGPLISEKNREQFPEASEEQDPEIDSGTRPSSHSRPTEFLYERPPAGEFATPRAAQAPLLEAAANLPRVTSQAQAPLRPPTSIPQPAGSSVPSRFMPQRESAGPNANPPTQRGEQTPESAARSRTAPPATEPRGEPRGKVAEIEPQLQAHPARTKTGKENHAAKAFTVAELPAALRRIIEAHTAAQAQKPWSAAARANQPPEPTIQVTIGRIEVRAAQHSAPPVKRSSTSPVTTLDDYLRRRSQRGSR